MSCYWRSGLQCPNGRLGICPYICGGHVHQVGLMLYMLWLLDAVGGLCELQKGLALVAHGSSQLSMRNQIPLLCDSTGFELMAGQDSCPLVGCCSCDCRHV